MHLFYMARSPLEFIGMLVLFYFLKESPAAAISIGIVVAIIWMFLSHIFMGLLIIGGLIFMMRKS